MSKKLLWIVGGVVMIAIIIWFVMGSGNSEAEDLPSIDVVEDVEEEVPVVTSPTRTLPPKSSPVANTVVPAPAPEEVPWEQGPSDPPVVPPPSGGGSSSQTPWGQGPSV